MVYGTLVKDDRLTAARYMPPYRPFTGCFQIDARVEHALESNPLQAAFEVFSLFLDQELPQTYGDENGVLFLDAGLQCQHSMGERGFLSNVWFTRLAPEQYRVVFVRLPAVTNTTKASALVTPSLPTSPSIARELGTPASALLNEIVQNDLWSLRELEPILGVSHQTISRISKGSAPASEVRQRIDDLYRFYKRIHKMVEGNRVAIDRLLTTRSEHNRKTANEWLQAQDFKKAFSAVMDIASPALGLPETEDLPLKWYDRPSTAIEDLERPTR